jgi:hypothetical protein
MTGSSAINCNEQGSPNMSGNTKIDEQLNVVIPVAGMKIHCMPISYEIFEKYFFILSKTFNALYSEVGPMVAPRVAYLTLKRIAENDGSWEGQEGIKNGLMNEIIRLSNVAVPVDGKGWEQLPLYEVLQQGKLTAKQKAEVLNEAVFFTVASCLYQEKMLRPHLEALLTFWSAQITVSSFMEYMNSLQTSTATANTGENTPAAAAQSVAPASAPAAAQQPAAPVAAQPGLPPGAKLSFKKQ